MDKPEKRIALVCQNYLPHIGGVETYVNRIVHSLEQKGQSSTVLTTDMNTPLNGRKKEAIYFKSSVSFMRNPFSMKMLNHLRKTEYDLIHLHSVWFLPSLLATLFRKNAKLLATVHGVYPDDSSRLLRTFLRIYKPIVQYVLDKSEIVSVYSKIEKDKLMRHFKINSDKITLIPMSINIIDPDQTPKKPFILFTGRIIPDKNPDVLIRALQYLDDRLKHFEVVFVGSIKPEYQKQLLQIKKGLKIVNPIRFEGTFDPTIELERTKLMSYYKEATIYASLGSWEGQPTRILEAMQFETPVIAYAAGGTEDMIRDNQNGLILKDLDPQTLGTRLNTVLANNQLLTQLGKAARKSIVANHNWEIAFQKIETLYE